MAKRQYSETNADSETQRGKINSNLRQVAPAGTLMPTIEIPPDDQIEASEGWRETWEISTAEGPIFVIFTGHDFHCSGSLGALVANGLMSPEWAPGVAGNNSTRQTVEFNADGAFLLMGKPRRSYGTADRLVIMRKSKATYDLSIPGTTEQRALIEAYRKRMQAAADQEQSEELEEPVEQEPCEEPEQSQRRMLDPNDPDDLYVINKRLWASATLALDDVEHHLDPIGGVCYTEASKARILRLVDELRRAFAEGNLVPELPAIEQRGNVIAWPGRGCVGAVSLT